MRPTRRALALAALGLPLALLPAAVDVRLWPLWPVFLGLFVGALCGDVLLAPRRKDLAVTAEAPASLFLGEPAEAYLTLAFPGDRTRRTRRIEVAVDLSARLVPQPLLSGVIGAANPANPAGDAGARLACRLEAVRRGRAEIERASVRYAGPLGLVARTAVLAIDKRIAVLPNVLPVHRAALRFAADREFRAGLKIERYAGDGTELDSLREFVPGDDPGTVDWKSSAHHGKLLARQNRAERNHQVILALDTGRLMSEPLAGIPRLDRALEAALLLSYVSLKAGDRVGLYTFGARPGLWALPRGGMESFATVNRLAADVDYSDDETNFTLGLTALGERLSRRSLVVVFTDFVDTVTAELMMENLGRLSRRHALVFVATSDPGLAAVAQALPQDLLALNRAVVAGLLRTDRELVVRRLTLLGVRAIDAPPGEVSPRLVNAYLDLKRRERV